MNPYFFPEVNHALIQPLLEMDDLRLLDLWQQYPDEGKYSVAVFCRYTPQTFALLNNIPTQGVTEYLFTYAWQLIFAKLPDSFLMEYCSRENFQELQEWIEDIIKMVIEEHEVLQITPPKTTLPARYFPLQYYLEQSLPHIHPFYRLILVTKEKFGWQENQILDYLTNKGYDLSSQELRDYHAQAYKDLLEKIPDDIHDIYL